METMTLNRRVHFLIDPERFAALEDLARQRRKSTGENTTLGILLREAVDEYLKTRQAGIEPRPRRRKVS
jgi:predicted RNA-binding Zn ribbon-like protein